MATVEWVRKAISNGKLYEELPPRVKTLLPQAEWNLKVKEYCHQRGLRWADSLAKTTCGEQEYYEDLVRFYRQQLRLYPYALADFVCARLRVSPFKYYCDLLFSVMREERSYDFIPNFTAADIVRVVGIGRNLYIDLMNQCKAKKLLWRINKAIAKDLLPTEPLPLRAEPWWVVHVVNLGEVEYQQLTPAELRVCRSVVGKNGQPVSALPAAELAALYMRDLVHVDVPIRGSDHVSIPPLEGFVSNKDSDTTGERGDPIEGLLYAIFVATTERADVASLADVLSVELAKLQEAVSVCVRLGFGTRLEAAERAAPASSTPTNPFVLDLEEEEAISSGLGQTGRLDAAAALEGGGGGGGGGEGGALAVVVDAEVTSYLMMGALSPGLKRHSVSLFEGGRVTGTDVIAEMIRELHLSVDAARGFEGEMGRLSSYSRALVRTLETVAAAGGGAPLELLRKESLTGLPPAAAARVLAHSYQAVIPIAPLPYPPLPLSPMRPGPTTFGSTIEAATPWLQLVLYVALRQGPPCLVLPAGQRLWRLPPGLAGCSQALMWPWAPGAVRAEAVPSLLDAAFLLASLNENLSRTALLVQPLHLPSGELTTVDVPLPLVGAPGDAVTAVATASGELVRVPAPPRLRQAVRELGLGYSLGYLRLLQVPDDSADQQPGAAASPDQQPEPPAGSGASPQTEAASAAEAVQPAPQPEAQPELFAELLNGGAAVMPVPAAPEPDASGQDSATSTAAAWSEPEAQQPVAAAARELGGSWMPLQLALGLPLAPAELNELVCKNALAGRFLEADSRAAQQAGQRQLQARLFAFISEFGACSNCLGATGGITGSAPSHVDLPLQNLLFDGQELWEVELTDYLQGIGMLTFD